MSTHMDTSDSSSTRRDLLRQAAAISAGSALAGSALAQGPTGDAGTATTPASETQPGKPPRPWQRYINHPVPPGEPGVHYRPVFVPNGETLPYRVLDGTKIYHLIAEEIIHSVADGLTTHAWGFNGRTPGPPTWSTSSPATKSA